MRALCWMVLLPEVWLVMACSQGPAPSAVDAGQPLCDALHGGLYVLNPVTIPLHEVGGIASNPGDFPLGDDVESRTRRLGYWRTAEQLGHASIRRDFRWKEIEPQKGTFDFTRQDQLVAEAQAHGIRILGSLLYGNPWARADGQQDEFFPPDDPADFGRFAKATAEHFAGRVDEWEIWNEPNGGFRFWKGTDLSGDPYGYADLLAAAHDGVKAGNPDAKVLLGGTVFTPQFIEGAIPWLDDAYHHRADLGSRFEIAGVHGYQSYPPNVAPELGQGNGLTEDLPLAAKIQAHACLMQAHGVRDHPIWVTELGWPVYQNVDEDAQARYLVRSTILAARAGASRTFWYTLRDGPNPAGYPPEDAFGLLHNDGDFANGMEATPKKAVAALTSLMNVLGDLHPTDEDPGVTGLPADGQAVLFRGNGGRAVVVVWTVTTAQAAATVRPGGVVMDAYATGSCVDAPTSETVMASPDVTYVVRSCGS